MTERTIDPINWYSERELAFCPKHFVATKAPLTVESKQWVLNSLNGRFAILPCLDVILLIPNTIGQIAFEDPKEALVYELKWS